MNYRPEIDGLRALAVVPVVLFHAGVFGVSGGYIGVDIFFVISGYLITAKVHGDLAKGRFRLLEFYERRARRILPLLLCVIIACIPATFFLFTPGDYSRFANSIIPALKLTSEIFFRRAGGYFDVIDYPRPLLHTWSLSIEEKYYIAFPIVFGLIFAKWRGAMTSALSVTTICLFCVSVSLSIARPDGSYYMFWARIWEILLGATVAVYGTRLSDIVSLRAKPAVEWGAVGALACCAYAFNAHTPYPGFYSAIPSVSTAILIAVSNTRSTLGKLLASRSAVFIGLLSYSIYMWHLPAIVIAEEIGWFDTIAQKTLILLGVFAVSYLSWRFIEKPFRSTPIVSTKQFLVTSTLTIALVLSAASYLKTFEDGRIASVTPQTTSDLQLVDECFLVATAEFSPKCLLSEQKQRPQILLIGDSHASAIYPELSSWALSKNVELKLMSAAYCLPLVLEFPTNKSQAATKRCEEVNKTIYDEIEDRKPDLIIVASYMYLWSAAAGAVPLDDRWSYPAYFQDFKSSLSRMAKSHRVVVFGQVPTWEKPLPDLVAQELGVFNQHLEDVPQYSDRGMHVGLVKFDADYRRAVEDAGATYLSVLDAVCNSTGCPRFEMNSRNHPELTTFDYGHLSKVGAESFISKVLAPKLNKLFK